jgi:hypothetical protein
VLVDNFRLLHGRDPYQDLRRKLWRLWLWTDGCAFQGWPKSRHRARRIGKECISK